MRFKFRRFLQLFLFSTLLITVNSCTFTNIEVWLFQDFARYYTGRPINSYNPKFPPSEGVSAEGKYAIHQINYGENNSPYYPNSYMDIFYSTENPADASDKSTIIFIHGGCFWWGDTTTGNPIDHSNFYNYIMALTDAGFNVVMIDYALSPQYLFPTPIIQVNQAIDFLLTEDQDGHTTAEKYNLNMESVILGGNSAGAVICSQYVASITNSKYRNSLNLKEGKFSTENLKAVILDDGFWDWNNMNSAVKVVVGNYMNKTLYLGSKTVYKYDVTNHLTENYPPTVMSVSTFTYDGKRLNNKLKSLGVETLCIKPNEDRDANEPHCYMIKKIGKDKEVKKEFDSMIAFLKEQL